MFLKLLTRFSDFIPEKVVKFVANFENNLIFIRFGERCKWVKWAAKARVKEKLVKDRGREKEKPKGKTNPSPDHPAPGSSFPSVEYTDILNQRLVQFHPNNLLSEILETGYWPGGRLKVKNVLTTYFDFKIIFLGRHWNSCCVHLGVRDDELYL